jgi:hypothetical protein
VAGLPFAGFASGAQQRGEPFALGRRELRHGSGEGFDGQRQGVFGGNCTGFCSAVFGVWRFLRGKRRGFESSAAHLASVGVICVARHEMLQVCLANDEEMIEPLDPHTLREAFHQGVPDNSCANPYRE